MRFIRTPLAMALVAASFHAAAAAPDTEAVEFYNSRLDHYFITSTASEARSVDLGAAGDGWMRTGRSFPVWSDDAAAPADAQPVCRFYSSGANSHFYTASASECQSLKDMAAQELAATGKVRGWAFEGTAFHVQMPANGQCPAGTLAITRTYNNGHASGAGANHRYMDDSALHDDMDNRGWALEGAVFCAPPKATGTTAQLAATTRSFDAIVGAWHGDARWKTENRGVETRDTQALAITVAADGTVSGSGNGCTFSGKVSAGDGFRSLFKGTIGASGCANASFNGDYSWLHLERYEGGTLMLEMKRGDGVTEAMIDARLGDDAAAATPAQAAPVTTFGPVSGDWTGTAAWLAVSPPGVANGVNVQVNRTLSLTLSPAGAVSGAGLGCSFSGALTLPAAGKSEFGGTIVASGCDSAAFNGTFSGVQIHREDGGIEAELERQAADGTRVSISARLRATGATAGGTAGTGDDGPAAAAPTLPGAWQGNASWSTTQRVSGGTTTSTAKSDTLSVTVGPSGAITAAGAGCTGSGGGTLSADGRSLGAATITLSGCGDAAFNGRYDGVQILLEDGPAVEVELQRESESSGTKTQVRIGGRLARAG